MKLLLALTLAAVLPTFAAPKPNLMFILADDLGFSDIGCYGGEIETPNLDALAANGLRFTQFYNTTRCWPTRASLLTGYYAQQIHRDSLPDVRGGVPGTRQSWARLLPDLLKPAGYRSYHSGKWHIDGKVLAGGFDHSLHQMNPGNFFTARGTFRDDVEWRPQEADAGYYATVATADHVVECLRDHASNHSDRPFFHYVAFHAPHFPLHALPEDIARYRDRYLDGWEAMRRARFERLQQSGIIQTSLSKLEPEVGPPYPFPNDLKKLGPGEIDRPLPWADLTGEQRKFQALKMAIHAAMVDRMDREIGRIIAQLKAMGAYENTLILFASDNGASAEIMVRDGGHDPQAEPGSKASYLCLGPGFSSACNTPFRRHKSWLHEGGIATPLIAHWPAGIRGGNALRRTPSHVIDFVPTALELAGLEKPAEWGGEPIPEAPGRSLVPAFAEDVTIARDCLWWMHEKHRAVRVGDWKLVADAGRPWELYNLTKDRAEQDDLAAAMPEKVREMETVWQGKADAFTALVRKTPRNIPGGGGAAKPSAPPFTPAADLKGEWAMTPDPALPNILILGDSISIGYTREVRRLLAGRANVFRPMAAGGRTPANCGDTMIGLQNLDAWLGGRKWDVIHFNWGLWDLCYRHPDSKAQGGRDKVNGKLSTQPVDYRRNLETLVARLKKTGAKLVWASTTLVPEGEVGRFVGDDVKYNSIAAEVMNQEGVAIHDLHALTRTFPPALFIRPGDVHFTAEGYARLGARVAETVGGLLPPQAAPEAP